MSCMSPLPHFCPVAMTPTFATGTSEPVSGECLAGGGTQSQRSLWVSPQEKGQVEASRSSQPGQIKLRLLAWQPWPGRP